MGHLLIWALSWFAAARLTRLANSDVLTEPYRNAWERAWEKRTTAAQKQYHDAWQEWDAYTRQNGHDEQRAESLRKIERKWFWKMERRRVARFFVSCPWCIGFWIYLTVTLIAWCAVAATVPVWPWEVLGGPWWFTLPAFALGGNWLYGIVSAFLDSGDE